MHEQFPPEVVAKRKILIPKLREANAKNHNAWIFYDTLFQLGIGNIGECAQNISVEL
jgi:hypothetical protein